MSKSLVKFSLASSALIAGMMLPTANFYSLSPFVSSEAKRGLASKR